MIYVIQCGEAAHFKLGFTDRSLECRIKCMQTGNPTPLKLLACKDDGTREEEKKLHGLMSRWKLSGEWFHPNAVLSKFVAAHAVADVSVSALALSLDEMKQMRDAGEIIGEKEIRARFGLSLSDMEGRPITPVVLTERLFVTASIREYLNGLIQ